MADQIDEALVEDFTNEEEDENKVDPVEIVNIEEQPATKKDPKDKRFEAVNNNKIGGLGSNVWNNRLGLEQTGSIFTFDSNVMANWFNDYFQLHGYNSIYFADAPVMSSGDQIKLPSMFFIFPKDQKIISSGKTSSDFEMEFLGRGSGAYLYLNSQFRNLVIPFVFDKKRIYVKESHKRNKLQQKFCYIQLDPEEVFNVLFLKNTSFRIAILDINRIGKINMYRVARIKKSADRVSSINEVLNDILR